MLLVLILKKIHNEHPNLRYWKNSLKDNSIEITCAEPDQLKEEFKEFNKKNWKQL